MNIFNPLFIFARIWVSEPALAIWALPCVLDMQAILAVSLYAEKSRIEQLK